MVAKNASLLRTTAAIRSAPHSLRSLRCSGFATFFLRLRGKPAYSAQKKRRIAANVVRINIKQGQNDKNSNSSICIAYSLSVR